MRAGCPWTGQRLTGGPQVDGEKSTKSKPAALSEFFVITGGSANVTSSKGLQFSSLGKFSLSVSVSLLTHKSLSLSFNHDPSYILVHFKLFV